MAIEMVDLVQEAAGKDLVALVLVPVAVAVLRTDDDMLCLLYTSWRGAPEGFTRRSGWLPL